MLHSSVYLKTKKHNQGYARQELGRLWGSIAGPESAGAECEVGVVVNQSCESFLFLSMSHSLYDAWALSLLHQQSRRIYESPNLEERDTTTIPYEKHLEVVTSRAQSRGQDNSGAVNCQTSNLAF